MIRFIVAMLVIASPALAHYDADWIRLQGLRNKMGEYCCGTQDCEAVDPARVTVGQFGYVISNSYGGDETIPYSEPQPFSIDGRLWVCRKPDGTRRCVFDQPKGM